MIVLALDPGKVNFGFAVVRKKPSKKATNLVCGRLGSSIDDIVCKLEDQVAALVRRIEEKIDRFKPDIIICERYMTRRVSGMNNELVNLAIGIVLGVAHQRKISIHLVCAATWKNYMQRAYQNNYMGEVLAHSYSDHASDAIGMSVWYLDKITKSRTLPHFVDTWKKRTCATCLGCAKPKKTDSCAKWRDTEPKLRKRRKR
jgi:Holliday junction resolvasome RuvABC endonuclease subunit